MPSSESEEESEVEERVCGTQVSNGSRHTVHLHVNFVAAAVKIAGRRSKNHVCDVQMQSVRTMLSMHVCGCQIED